MKVPILFIIFNRKETAQNAFQHIKKYQPEHLYIAADGPRKNKPGEDIICDETRQAILNEIDWPCNVKTLFRTANLGCAKAVSSALDWFFESEEFGVIVEDDIVLSQDFYRFAKEMDSKYRDDERIMCINAQYYGVEHRFDSSYVFTTMSSPWGWATWKRAWKYMDMSMKLYPHIPFKRYIKAFGLARGLMFYWMYWRQAYNILSKGGEISSWWTRWAFNIFANNGLVIAPTYNMAVNIGLTGTEGTHHTADDKNLYSFLELTSLPPILAHPKEICPNKEIIRIENRDFIRVRKHGAIKKLKNLFPGF